MVDVIVSVENAIEKLSNNSISLNNGAALSFHCTTAKTKAAAKPITVTGSKAFLALYKPRYKSTSGKTDKSIMVFMLFF
jgi:hypothetical protein